MKKILFVIAILLGFSLLSTSCNKEDVNSKNIVGTWQVEKYEYYLNGKLVKAETPTAKYYENGKIVKTEPATVYYIFTNNGIFYIGDNTDTSQLEKGTYSVQGNTLSLSKGITLSFLIKTLTSSQLVLDGTMAAAYFAEETDVEHDKAFIYFKRVK